LIHKFIKTQIVFIQFKVTYLITFIYSILELRKGLNYFQVFSKISSGQL